MIYATTADGVLIGLSKRNIELLQEGKPIYKKVQGMPTLHIFYGETEQAMVQMLVTEGLLASDHLDKLDL